MKITLQTNYIQPNFSARKKEIKKADDIQRKARECFPMVSPAYAENFYSITNDKTSAVKIAQKVVDKINAQRTYNKKAKELLPELEQTPFFLPLKSLKSMKIGNCEEAFSATVAALAANGYTDAKRMHLGIKGQLVNKETKKVIYETPNYDLDHVFAVSALGKENPQEKDYVVLDSWMGFADSISGAKSRYRALRKYNGESDIEIKKDFSLFRVDHFIKTNELLDWKNHEMRYKLVFEEVKNYTKEEMEALKIHTHVLYPELCL